MGGSALRRRQFREQATAVKSFDGGRGKAAHAEGQRFQGRIRVRGFFEDQHGNAGAAQLAGEKQPDRAGSGNDYIVDQGMRHELLLQSRSTGAVHRDENHTDELRAREWRQLFVEGTHA
jgi:hypothetical protein